MNDRLTIVWDIDGTLGRYYPGFQVALRRRGHPAGNYPPPNDYNFAKAGWFATTEEFLSFHAQAVADGLFLDMEPEATAVSAVRALADRGVRQVIATHRLIAGLDHIVRDTTLAWLDATFDVTFDEIHFTADKWSASGDLYVDDAPAVIASLDERGLNRLVMDAANYNQHLPGPRVYTCNDVIAHVDVLLDAQRKVAA